PQPKPQNKPQKKNSAYDFLPIGELRNRNGWIRLGRRRRRRVGRGCWLKVVRRVDRRLDTADRRRRVGRWRGVGGFGI
ncbi:hypothetical protein HK097_010746, partial [Rhizophlyctis rosea]